MSTRAISPGYSLQRDAEAPGLLARIGTLGRVHAWWPLLLVLSLQAALAITTLHNTAFQDEGLYLYAGRQLLQAWMGGPAPVEQYAFYFSGYPYIYPVIGGALDMLGGLELARALSLACMLGVTGLAYLCTRRMFGARPALFAAAAYAFIGTVLYVSRLATFDALCLFLIALAAAIALRAATERRLGPTLILGPLLTLAILTKYAAMLFVPPVLGLLVVGSVTYLGWRPMLPRVAVAVASLGISVALTLLLMDQQALHAIVHSTTSRVPGLEAPRWEMFKHALYMGGVVYGLGLFGLVLIFLRQPRFAMIALVLFGSALLIPAYHIYERETISFDKHLAYGLFFVVPLAGYAMAWMGGSMDWNEKVPSSAAQRPFGVAALAAVLIVFVLGLQQSQWLYSSWANSSAVSAVLHTQMRDGSGRYLAEDIEVARYDDRDVTQAWQWNGPYYFSYQTADHRQLFGDQAVTQEINDRYFAIVELSFIYQPNTAFYIAERMAESRNYDLIAVIPFQNSYGSGNFYIWRSALVAGQGNFTSLSQLGL
jgi:4-amino-4-deoxy-L-arabinose transferase-like glycosyltransferase